LTTVDSRPSQVPSCSLCRQIITTLIGQVGSAVTEEEVDAYLRLGCATFFLDSWCQQHVYPNIREIFLALRNNKTDDIICERITLCKFKVTSITGDILFADGDVLYTIRELSDKKLQHITFGTIAHPELPSGIITGLSCSVDYCAVLISSTNSDGVTTYGTTALAPYQQIHQVLPAGYWYGPWFDIMTQEFWMATGTAKQFTFGIFDPQYGNWEPKVYMRLRSRPDAELLSGQILDRILYFTVMNDPHVHRIDLTLRVSRGNFSTPNNTMLVGNPVTNELYGYAPGPLGIWRYNGYTGSNRTTVGNINLTGTMPVPSSTINPVDNTMWISLYGSGRDAWVRVDLKKATDNIGLAPTGNLDGLFDFNPYTITSEEV